MSARSSKRKRGPAVNYNVDALSSKFNIDGTSRGGRGSGRRKKKKKRSETTAEKERVAEGKQPYRGGAAPKPAPTAEVLDERQPMPTHQQARRARFPRLPRVPPESHPRRSCASDRLATRTFARSRLASRGSYTTKQVLAEFPKEWFDGLDVKSQLRKQDVRQAREPLRRQVRRVSRHVGELRVDLVYRPYGWFSGTAVLSGALRSTDDERQIKRGLGVCGVKGRFRNQLIGKCARGGTSFDDERISPVIRQALQHWGYVLTKRDADKCIEAEEIAKAEGASPGEKPRAHVS